MLEVTLLRIDPTNKPATTDIAEKINMAAIEIRCIWRMFQMPKAVKEIP